MELYFFLASCFLAINLWIAYSIARFAQNKVPDARQIIYAKEIADRRLKAYDTALKQVSSLFASETSTESGVSRRNPTEDEARFIDYRAELYNLAEHIPWFSPRSLELHDQHRKAVEKLLALWAEQSLERPAHTDEGKEVRKTALALMQSLVSDYHRMPALDAFDAERARNPKNKNH